jgi:tight adherence protein B
MNGVILVLGVGAIFVALLLFGLLATSPTGVDPTPFERLRLALRRRPPNPSRSLHSIKDRASAIAEHSLERSGRRSRLEQALERAGIDMRPGEFVVLATTAAFAAFAVGALVGGALLALIFAGCVVAGTRFSVTLKAERRLAKFDAQLETTLPLMAGSLRAGFGLMQALDAVARESEAPTSDEFQRLVMESRLGRDLGDSLEAMQDRVRSEDFAFVVQAIEIHREVGGDLAQVLDNVTTTIRDRNRIRRQVKSLSAEGRFSAAILFCLPLLLVVAIQFLNPSYLHELTAHTVGRVVLGIGASLLVVGGLWMRRMTRLVF